MSHRQRIALVKVRPWNLKGRVLLQRLPPTGPGPHFLDVDANSKLRKRRFLRRQLPARPLASMYLHTWGRSWRRRKSRAPGTWVGCGLRQPTPRTMPRGPLSLVTCPAKGLRSWKRKGWHWMILQGKLQKEFWRTRSQLEVEGFKDESGQELDEDILHVRRSTRRPLEKDWPT